MHHACMSCIMVTCTAVDICVFCHLVVLVRLSVLASDWLQRLVSKMTYNVLMGTLNPTHSLTHLLCVIKVIDLDLPKLAWQCIRIRDCIGTSVSPNGVHRRWFPIVIQCQICGGQLPPHASGWPSEEFKVHALKCELTVGSKINVWVDLWVIIEGIWSESFNSLCFGFSWNCTLLSSWGII